MKYAVSMLTCLFITNLAFAEAAPVTSGLPSLGLARQQRAVHRERMAAVALAVSGAVLTTTGGVVLGELSGRDGGTGSGIALTTMGSAALVSALYVSIDAAGHDAGLHQLRLVSDTPVDQQLMVLDGLEARVRRNEYVGIGLVVGGLALFGAGLGMTLYAVSGALGGGPADSSNGLFSAGIAISVVGDGAWMTGSLLSTYYGGKHRGIRETRRALSFSPTGISGTF